MPARAADPISFAISPTLPNRPVPVEIDRSRQLEIRRWLLVGALVVGAALFDGYQRFGIQSRGREFSEVQAQRAREEATARRLWIDVLALKSPKRIEPLARTELHLVSPTAADAVVLQRVVPAEQPPSSVVASR